VLALFGVLPRHNPVSFLFCGEIKPEGTPMTRRLASLIMSIILNVAMCAGALVAMLLMWRMFRDYAG
jgi:hypothetical protein